MTQILWQPSTQVIDVIGFFGTRSQTQAPKIRGLRHPEKDSAEIVGRQTQAPKIRGLRRERSFISRSEAAKPKPRKSGD